VLFLFCCNEREREREREKKKRRSKERVEMVQKSAARFYVFVFQIIRRNCLFSDVGCVIKRKLIIIRG
jgi:hypothetical protein